MTASRTATLAATIVVPVLLVTGCGASDTPSNGTSPGGVTVDVVIKHGKATPQGARVDVKVDQPVHLHVTSDADEEVHVHSDPEHEYEVAPGTDRTYTFTLGVPGQVAVEAHHLDVTIAQLVVRP